MAGIPRNYEVFDPLDFLAEVTQHIPNKGEHQIRYYGAYSNKSRGMKAKAQKPGSVPVPGMPEAESSFVTKHRMTWAALIKAVYEVDPLKCPSCGGTMKIIGFIERRQTDVIQKILRHCGLWKNAPPRPPPLPAPITEPAVHEQVLDYGFTSTTLSASFESTCI